MSAIILPYRPRPSNRMTRLDRRDAHNWLRGARAMGYAHIIFDTAGEDNDPDNGDYVVIYGHNEQWHSWGVCRCGGKYRLWRGSDGRTMAVADRIVEALAAIPPFPPRRKRA